MNDRAQGAAGPTPSALPRWFLAAALAGLGLRALLFAQYLRSPFLDHLVLDALSYWDWAGRIAAGQWVPREVFAQGPLYPYVLALGRVGLPGFAPSWVAAGQLVLNWATSLLFYPLLRQRWEERPALTAAALALFFGPAAFFSLKVLSTTVGLFLLLGGLVMLHRAGVPRPAAGVAGGFLTGLACLSTPPLVPAALVAALAVPSDRSLRLRTTLPVLAGLMLAIAPATVSNFLQDGGWVPISSNYGITFFQGNNERSLGTYTWVEGVSTRIEQQDADAAALAEREAGRPLTRAEVARHFVRKSLRLAASYPVGYLTLLGKKAVLLLGGTDIPLEYAHVLERRDSLPTLWLFPLGGTPLLALAALGLGRGLRERGPPVPFLLLPAALGLLCLAFFVVNRYAYPFQFFLLPLVAAALLNPPLRQPRALPVAAAALVLLCSRGSLAILTPEARESHYQACLGSAYERGGDFASAGQAWARALAAIPDDVDTQAKLAENDLRQGRTAAAEQALRRLLKTRPDHAASHALLALALSRQDRPAEAREHLEWAVASDPRNPETRGQLVDFLLAWGDQSGAEAQARAAVRAEPSSAAAHFVLSRALRGAGRASEARQELQTALDLDPSMAEAANDLAVLEFTGGNVRRAQRLAERAAALGYPVSPRFREDLTHALAAPSP
ncbi:MAG: tetratricopeptide repeat protein [Deltaproteobacteria bacterium]|nr:tetratricopeptide repeat protein [Deltaproteobacteria bacterium]